MDRDTPWRERGFDKRDGGGRGRGIERTAAQQGGGGVAEEGDASGEECKGAGLRCRGQLTRGTAEGSGRRRRRRLVAAVEDTSLEGISPPIQLQPGARSRPLHCWSGMYRSEGRPTGTLSAGPPPASVPPTSPPPPKPRPTQPHPSCKWSSSCPRRSGRRPPHTPPRPSSPTSGGASGTRRGCP